MRHVRFILLSLAVIGCGGSGAPAEPDADLGTGTDPSDPETPPTPPPTRPPIDAGPVVDANPGGPSATEPFVIQIDAWVDGRSRLILQGGTVRWLHLDYAAPGRLGGADTPTVINTVTNTVQGTPTEWMPQWPAAGENRNCNCESAPFTALAPAMPAAPMYLYLKQVRAREDVEFVAGPSAANNYTTVIEFDDTDEGGADWYLIDLLVVPQPATPPPAP